MKHPEWIKLRLPIPSESDKIIDILKKNNVATVCHHALCPNKGECWNTGHATFMVLGSHCSRNCLFCNVESKTPLAVDVSEPARVAAAVIEMNLEYVVVTSVTRDDLIDKGAGHLAAVVDEIKKQDTNILVELLIPDLAGNKNFIEKIVSVRPDVIAHNIEMPRSLYPKIRKQSSYETSLYVLKTIKEIDPKMITKSSIIIGLGETIKEIIETFDDLKQINIDILYVGQYLSPSKEHWPVAKYYTPEEFKEIQIIAFEMGFKAVMAEPLVRSSYKAASSYRQVCK
ncbi:MAG: lipoyl synthase [Candidatus Omnitrophica bacterium]|nr:lipoyl synthase [Candidatus Omnitrophota bacterium]